MEKGPKLLKSGSWTETSHGDEMLFKRGRRSVACGVPAQSACSSWQRLPCRSEFVYKFDNKFVSEVYLVVQETASRVT